MELIVSLFHIFHLHFDDAQHVFHKREGVKTGVFLLFTGLQRLRLK